MPCTDDIPEAAALAAAVASLSRSRRTIAFTGAGVSTLAGIPAFRGRDGIFSQTWKSWRVEELFDIDVFRAHPEEFYAFSRDFLYNLDERQPGPVHMLLAALESRGLLQDVYTQNIDMLHQRAGSGRVHELHGSPRQHHCLQCGRAAGYAEIKPLVRAGVLPRCPGCGGLYKPDVVFFGEMLDAALLRQAEADFATAEVVLVLGSSLAVQPAAGLLQFTRRGGGRIIIVNRDPTPYDAHAAIRLHDLDQAAAYLRRSLTQS